MEVWVGLLVEEEVVQQHPGQQAELEGESLAPQKLGAGSETLPEEEGRVSQEVEAPEGVSGDQRRGGAREQAFGFQVNVSSVRPSERRLETPSSGGSLYPTAECPSQK